jgi:L-asparaginase
MTGAMRSSNELGSDGIYNYRTALRVAADEKSADKGVLVVMNDEIHREVCNKNTYNKCFNLSNTNSWTLGPCNKTKYSFSRCRQTCPLRFTGHQWCCPNHQIIRRYGYYLTGCTCRAPISGLVIEALAGNLPPASIATIKKLINKQLPIVLVSRCFNGIAEPVYAYDGGGIQLEELGVLFVKELNSQKARIKLLIAVNAGLNGQDLADYIQG